MQKDGIHVCKMGGQRPLSATGLCERSHCLSHRVNELGDCRNILGWVQCETTFYLVRAGLITSEVWKQVWKTSPLPTPISSNKCILFQTFHSDNNWFLKKNTIVLYPLAYSSPSSIELAKTPGIRNAVSWLSSGKYGMTCYGAHLHFTLLPVGIHENTGLQPLLHKKILLTCR